MSDEFNEAAMCVQITDESQEDGCKFVTFFAVQHWM